MWCSFIAQTINLSCPLKIAGPVKALGLVFLIPFQNFWRGIFLVCTLLVVAANKANCEDELDLVINP